MSHSKFFTRAALAAFAVFASASLMPIDTAQAAACPVNKSIFKGDLNKCSAPKGTRQVRVSNGYYQYKPVACPKNKSIFAANKCACPRGTKARQVSAGYRQCR